MRLAETGGKHLKQVERSAMGVVLSAADSLAPEQYRQDGGAKPADDRHDETHRCEDNGLRRAEGFFQVGTERGQLGTHVSAEAIEVAPEAIEGGIVRHLSGRLAAERLSRGTDNTVFGDQHRRGMGQPRLL